MADKDVTLVIRAKNEASKTFDEASEAISKFAKVASTASQTANRFGNFISQLSDDSRKLVSQISGLQALSKINLTLDSAANAVKRMSDALKSSKDDLDSLKEQYAKAGENVQKLQAASDSLRASQSKQTETASVLKKELSNTNKELRDAQRAYDAINKTVAKNDAQTQAALTAGEAAAQSRKQLDAASEAVEKTKLQYEGYGLAVKEVKKNLKDAEAAARNAQKAFDLANAPKAKRKTIDTSVDDKAVLQDNVDKTARAANQARLVYDNLVKDMERAKASMQSANAVLRESENAYKSLERAASKAPQGGAFTNAAESAKVFAKAELDKANASVIEASNKYDTLRNSIKATKDELAQTAIALRNATTQENALANSVDAASLKYERQAASFEKASNELDTIRKLSSDASKALNTVGASQEDLAKASANANAALQRTTELQAALKQFSTGTGGFSDPKTAASMRAQSEQVERARKTYELLNNELERVKAAMASTVQPTAAEAAAFRDLTAATKQAQLELQRQITTLNELPSTAGRARSVNGLFTDMYGESRKAMSVLQRIRGEILSITAAYVGLYAAGDQITGVIDAYKKFEAAENRIGVVMNQNQAAIGSEMDYVSRLAARLGMDMGVLSDEYSKFAIAAKQAGFSMDSVRKIFTSVSEASRVNKNTMEQTSGIFLALTQMISKGKVASEELRRQLGDRMAGAFNLFAKSLGVTTAELDKMMRNGQVLADEKTLLSFAQTLSDQFGNQLPASLRTLTTHLGQFENQMYQMRLLIGKGGFVDALNSLFDDLNEKMNSREGRDFFLAIGAAAGKLVDALKFVVNNLDLFAQIINALIAVKVTQWIIGLYTAFNTTGTSLNALRLRLTEIKAAFLATAESAGVLRAVMTSLTAVMRKFLPMLAIGVAADAVLNFFEGMVTKVPEATSALDEHQQIMQKLLNSYDALQQKSKNPITFADVKDSVSIKDADQNFYKLKDSYDKAISELRDSADVNGAMSWNPLTWLSKGIGSGAKSAYDSVYASLTGTQNEFEKLAKIRIDVVANTKPLDDISKSLNDLISTSTNDAIKREAIELANQVDKVNELSKAKKEAAEVSAGLGSKSSEVADELKGETKTLESMAKAQEDSTKAQEEAIKAASDYQDALKELRDVVPELAKEAKQLELATKIDDTYRRAIDDIGKSAADTATKMKMLADATNVYNAAKKEINFEALPDELLKERRSGAGGGRSEVASVAASLAGRYGLSTEDVLTAMYYESGGVPNRWGGSGGKYYGLLQFSPDSRRRYGMPENASASEQLPAFYRYFDDRGFKPGMGFRNFYATINTGTPFSNAGDIRNGGRNKSVDSAIASSAMEDARRWAKSVVKVWSDVGEDARKQAEKQRHGEDATKEQIASGKEKLRQQDLILAGKEREAFIEGKVNEALKSNSNISKDSLNIIRQQAAAEYDNQQKIQAQKKEKTEIQKLEENLNRLLERRRLLEERRTEYARRGDAKGVKEVDRSLIKLNVETVDLINKMQEYYKTSNSADAKDMIEKLENTKLQIQTVGKVALWSGEQITNIMSGSITNSIESFARAWANGEKGIKDVWEVFTAFASDFAIQMGRMLVQAAAFKLLSPLGGWISNGMNGLMATMHTGGIVTGAMSTTRSVDMTAFAAPFVYHSGGFAGLRPDEVPAILQKNEEVITRDDPRHTFNGGRNAGMQNIKIVNTFDSTDVVSAGLNTAVGEKAIINVVKRRSSEIKAALK